MSESRSNPRSIAKKNGQPMPALPMAKEILGHKLELHRRPKKHVLVVNREHVVEQDGARFLMAGAGRLEPIPAGAELVYVGEPIPENADHMFDVVLEAYGVYGEPSGIIVGQDGNVRAAGVMLTELMRVDYADFKRRARAALNGDKAVPGYNEHPEPWHPTSETS